MISLILATSYSCYEKDGQMNVTIFSYKAKVYFSSVLN